MTDLRKACEHGMYHSHFTGDASKVAPNCPGGSEPTVDDLIAEIQSRGIPGSVRIQYVGPKAEPVYVDEVLSNPKPTTEGTR